MGGLVLARLAGLPGLLGLALGGREAQGALLGGALGVEGEEAVDDLVLEGCAGPALGGTGRSVDGVGVGRRLEHFQFPAGSVIVQTDQLTSVCCPGCGAG